MLTYLLEHPYQVYFLLSLIGVLLILAWWKTRQWKYLIGVIGVAAIYVVCAVLTLINETAHQQIDRKIHEMAAAIAAHDLDRAFAHISNDFSANRVNKAMLRRQADHAIRHFSIHEALVWDVKFLDDEPATIRYQSGGEWRSAPAEKVAFEFKIKSDPSDSGYWCHCEAIFVREPDGQWRMKSFDLFDGVKRQKLNFPAPGR